MKHFQLFLIGALALAACGQAAPVPVESGSVAATPAPGRAQPQSVRSGDLQFSAQPGWVEEPPSNTMRVAQYRLPPVEGDSAAAELAVTAKIGGSPSDNLARWVSFFELPPGTQASTTVEERGELRLHRVDVAGTYVAETTPGSGVRLNEANWRMLGAVVESPYGPYYFKLVGPAATVEHWKESFDAFLAALKP
jgi:hypothetical protein